MTFRLRWLAALLAALVMGGCGMVGSRSESDHPWDEPENPLTDEQTMAQVVDPAKDVVRALPQLDDVTGGFSYGSCNDQGAPPFQGRVEVAFKLPADPDTLFGQIRDTMLKQGWSAGAPEGQKVHGGGLNRNGVTATVGPRAADPGYGSLKLYGECRNVGEHLGEDAVNLTDQLR